MIYTIKARQFLKTGRQNAWEFIRSPHNLALITPPYMGFKIIGDRGDLEKMYPGQIIQYRVSPLMGVGMRWVTEITHVEDGNYFVDEQRFGPYAFWHHKHFLKEVPGGVEMTDIVHYKLPFGIVGRLLNFCLVRKKLKEIFDYRSERIDHIFNRNP